jgi:hypothetical protein
MWIENVAYRIDVNTLLFGERIQILAPSIHRKFPA